MSARSPASSATTKNKVLGGAARKKGGGMPPPSGPVDGTVSVFPAPAPYPRARLIEDYFGLKTADLMALFAAGRPTPGAGSLAGVGGAWAGASLQSVAKYTVKAADNGHVKYQEFRARAVEIRTQSEALWRSLQAAAVNDALAYAGYRERKHKLQEGMQQGQRAEEWAQLRAAAEESLKQSIEVPLDIARCCIRLAEMGIELLTHGYQGARSQCLTALKQVIASAEGAVQTASENLRDLMDQEWRERGLEAVSRFQLQLAKLRQVADRAFYPPHLLA